MASPSALQRCARTSSSWRACIRAVHCRAGPLSASAIDNSIHALCRLSAVHGVQLQCRRHGIGRWQQVITDPDEDIGPLLRARSNVDLKVGDMPCCWSNLLGSQFQGSASVGQELGACACAGNHHP